MTKDRVTYTLITNMDYVTVGDLRLHASAILIEDGDYHGMGDKCQMRLFGPDPAWPVTTVDFDRASQWPVELRIREETIGKSDWVVKYHELVDAKKQVVVKIWRANDDLDVDVWKRVGDIQAVWKELTLRTNRFFRSPFRPYLNFAPPFNEDNARRTLETRLVVR